MLSLLLIPGAAILWSGNLLLRRYRRLQAEQRNAEKKELLAFADPAALQQLDDLRFLEFTAKLFSHLGYTTYLVSRDDAAEYHLLLFKQQGKYVARCRKHDQGIGQGHLQPLLVALQKNYADKAFFITADFFTKSALDFSAKNPIELIDGEHLVTLAVQAFTPHETAAAAGK